jgi:hypothetical protein
MTRAERKASLQKIAARCETPADRLQLNWLGSPKIVPQPSDRYEKINCLLSASQRLRGLPTNLVGNEAYAKDPS